MMSDILVPIIFLMILTFVFWMGWAIGKNQSIRAQPLPSISGLFLKRRPCTPQTIGLKDCSIMIAYTVGKEYVRDETRSYVYI